MGDECEQTRHCRAWEAAVSSVGDEWFGSGREGGEGTPKDGSEKQRKDEAVGFWSHGFEMEVGWWFLVSENSPQ